MFIRRSTIHAALAALLAAPLIVSAAPQFGEASPDGTAVYRGPEAGWVMRGYEYGPQNGANGAKGKRSAVAAIPAASNSRLGEVRGDISADGEYVYSGPEAGWIFRPHNYALAKGGIVHTDARDMNKPALDPLARRATQAGDVSTDGNYMYRNAEAAWTLRQPQAAVR